MTSGRFDFSFHHVLESDDGGDREAKDLTMVTCQQGRFGDESFAKVLSASHFVNTFRHVDGAVGFRSSW